MTVEKKKQLDDVCNVEYGTRVVQRFDGGSIYPVYGGGGATFHMDEFNREDRVVIARFGMSEECTRFVEGKFFLNDSGLTVSPKTCALLPRFLDYQMLSLNDEIYAVGKGAAQKNLDVPAFRALRLFVPSDTKEQHRIVGILDEAFNGIAIAKANAERNLQSSYALFESHLQFIFTQRGSGWAVKPLAELCNIKHGFAFKSEFFTTEGDYVVLTPGNFYESGGYRDRGEKQKYYSGEIPPGFILDKGDLLVAMTEQAAGLLGSPILVPESDKFLHNQRLGLVTKRPGVPWTSEFFFHVFNTQAVRKEIHDSASGVKVRHTSPTKIGQVVVSYPISTSKQCAIVSALNDLKKETKYLESIYKRKLIALSELRESLLHKAFAGELTTQTRKSIVIPFPIKIPNISTTDLHAGILAIAYELHERNKKQNYLGHVKAEKISHMVEAHLGIDLERDPVKDAAGPDDYPHLLRVEHRAKMAGYFLFRRTKGSGYKITKYRKFDSLIERTRSALDERNRDIDELFKLMLGLDTKQAEIFATVYAAWNNLLLDKQPITDEAIVFEARENWHPDKLKIKRTRFFEAIKWMKEKAVIPTGKGKKVNSKVKKKKQ